MMNVQRILLIAESVVVGIGLVLSVLFSYITSGPVCWVVSLSCSAYSYFAFTSDTLIGVAVIFVGLVLVTIGIIQVPKPAHMPPDQA